MVGTGKTFSLPLSIILRMGIGLYGIGEEFGAVGEECICIRDSIYPGRLLGKKKLISHWQSACLRQVETLPKDISLGNFSRLIIP